MASGVLKEGEDPKSVSDQQWRDRLSEQQYSVTREHGTEYAYTGAYYQHAENGTYHCVCCGNKLFSSSTKYDSGSGWPSFFDILRDGSSECVKRKTDDSLGMVRTEVTCAKCDAHLGHVFDDGPTPTGQRYCINSASLEFEPGKAKDEGSKL